MAGNDPEPILDCSGCLVSSLIHQGFSPVFFCWFLPLAEIAIVKAELCAKVLAWVRRRQPTAARINAYIIRESTLLCPPLTLHVKSGEGGFIYMAVRVRNRSCIINTEILPDHHHIATYYWFGRIQNISYTALNLPFNLKCLKHKCCTFHDICLLKKW